MQDFVIKVVYSVQLQLTLNVLCISNISVIVAISMIVSMYYLLAAPLITKIIGCKPV